MIYVGFLSVPDIIPNLGPADPYRRYEMNIAMCQKRIISRRSFVIREELILSQLMSELNGEQAVWRTKKQFQLLRSFRK